MNESVKVSVCMVTFNHEAYIVQAIEGVLMQESNFEFELIISDDASSDNTESIVSNIIENHPRAFRIKYIRNSENKGMMENFSWVLLNCRGEFIALCDGDDYWTDPFKLQKQVDFLEANPNFVLTYHPVDVLFPDGRMEEDFGIKGIIDKSETNIYDLAALGNYIHTPSVLFRNKIGDFPLQFNQTPVGDFFLYMLLAQYGKLYRLSANMAVYRYGVGIHSTQDKKERMNRWVRTLVLIKEAIEDKTVKKILEFRINNHLFHTLPGNLQSLQSLHEINTSKILIKFVPLKNLLLAIIRKFWR